MKKLAILLILALICAPAGLAEGRSMRDDVKGRLSRPGAASAEPTAAPEAPAYDDPLLNIAIEMIVNVHTLARDAEYCDYYGVSNPEYIPRLIETDPYDLRTVYDIVLPYDIIKLTSGVNLKLSNIAREYSFGYEAANFHNLWNGGRSIEAAMELSCLQWDKPYFAPENFEPRTWLVDCGGALYWVAFTHGNEGIMTVSATPLWMEEGENINTALAYLDERMQMVGVRQIWPESE